MSGQDDAGDRPDRSADPAKPGLTWRHVARAVGIAVGIVALACVATLLAIRGPFVFRVPAPPPETPVSAERLRQTVQYLSVDAGPRWYSNVKNLDNAARWIEDRFHECGLEVTTQEYPLREGTYRNVIAQRKGTNPRAGVVIVGAHYDAYGGLPGADDNASGVAVLLELARTPPSAPSRRTQIFVAFVNEEPPLFGSGDMGSARYARKVLEDGTPVDLMIALDLVGFFSDRPGSQHYPLKGLDLVYPSVGDFIAVVGDMGAGRWIEKVKRGMLSSRALPVVSFRAPSVTEVVLYSDHRSFRQLGLPGVMVTDMAFERSPHYHRRTDTLETLDFDKMADVVRAIRGVLWLEGQ
ncbi:MAG: M28 family peptidase [Acidobacteriia bacterium]|nr:M28 family peptidase [Terriglobia bacterium]